MRIAFKEWAIVVDALGRGDQIVILRKGGIHEGRRGFDVEHSRFFLFPTLFHQQRSCVVPSAQSRYDALAPRPTPNTIQIEFFAKVVDWKRLEHVEAALRLRGQHIWRDEVIRQRFEEGRSRSVYAIAVRVWRLPLPVDLPMLPHYGGCRSWVELAETIPTAGARTVLTDREFKQKLDEFHAAIESVAATAIV